MGTTSATRKSYGSVSINDVETRNCPACRRGVVRLRDPAAAWHCDHCGAEVAPPAAHAADTPVSVQLDVHCPACNELYQLSTRHLGRKAKCRCGVHFIVGDAQVFQTPAPRPMPTQPAPAPEVSAMPRAEMPRPQTITPPPPASPSVGFTLLEDEPAASNRGIELLDDALPPPPAGYALADDTDLGHPLRHSRYFTLQRPHHAKPQPAGRMCVTTRAILFYQLDWLRFACVGPLLALLPPVHRWITPKVVDRVPLEELAGITDVSTSQSRIRFHQRDGSWVELRLSNLGRGRLVEGHATFLTELLRERFGLELERTSETEWHVRGAPRIGAPQAIPAAHAPAAPPVPPQRPGSANPIAAEAKAPPAPVQPARKPKADGDWESLVAYLRGRGPAEISTANEASAAAVIGAYYQAVVAEPTSPKLTYYLLKASGSGATGTRVFPYVVVAVGELSEHNEAWNYDYDSILKRDLPGKTWSDFTWEGGYANHSKPGCQLASTAPFDRLAESIVNGSYQLERVFRPGTGESDAPAPSGPSTPPMASPMPRQPLASATAPGDVPIPFDVGSSAFTPLAACLVPAVAGPDAARVLPILGDVLTKRLRHRGFNVIWQSHPSQADLVVHVTRAASGNQFMRYVVPFSSPALIEVAVQLGDGHGGIAHQATYLRKAHFGMLGGTAANMLGTCAARIGAALAKDVGVVRPGAMEARRREIDATRKSLRAPAVALAAVPVLNVLVFLAARILLHPEGAAGLRSNDLFLMIFPQCVGLLLLGAGAVAMWTVASRRLAVAACVVAMLIPPCLIGIPVAIWALVTLNRTQVRQAFPDA